MRRWFGPVTVELVVEGEGVEVGGGFLSISWVLDV